MKVLRGCLTSLRSHPLLGWLLLIAYACAVSFPHEAVQELVGHLAERVTHQRVYQGSAALAVIEGLLFTLIFVRALRTQRERRWLPAFWILTLALLVATWRLFTANNTELVHYPQYFPEGLALVALTGSPAESMSWLVFFGGLDEAFQYTFLMQGRAAPFDFNDVYMDLVGGAAGIVFAMAVLGCERRAAARGWAKKLVARPGNALILSIVALGLALLASGKMLLYEAAGSPPHWFSLSRLRTPTFWYFSPVILGPHHFHELAPVEGTILLLVTIAFYSLLDRNVRIT